MLCSYVPVVSKLYSINNHYRCGMSHQDIMIDLSQKGNIYFDLSQKGNIYYQNCQQQMMHNPLLVVHLVMDHLNHLGTPMYQKHPVLLHQCKLKVLVLIVLRSVLLQRTLYFLVKVSMENFSSALCVCMNVFSFKTVHKETSI